MKRPFWAKRTIDKFAVEVFDEVGSAANQFKTLTLSVLK